MSAAANDMNADSVGVGEDERLGCGWRVGRVSRVVVAGSGLVGSVLFDFVAGVDQ